MGKIRVNVMSVFEVRYPRIQMWATPIACLPNSLRYVFFSIWVHCSCIRYNWVVMLRPQLTQVPRHNKCLFTVKIIITATIACLKTSEKICQNSFKWIQFSSDKWREVTGSKILTIQIIHYCRSPLTMEFVTLLWRNAIVFIAIDIILAFLHFGSACLARCFLFQPNSRAPRKQTLPCFRHTLPNIGPHLVARGLSFQTSPPSCPCAKDTSTERKGRNGNLGTIRLFLIRLPRWLCVCVYNMVTSLEGGYDVKDTSTDGWTARIVATKLKWLMPHLSQDNYL